MNQSPALPHHLSALGFERNPFPQTPDADSYFRTEAIEQQFTEALHCVKAGKGFVLLTGEVGNGKSTFLRGMIDQLLATDCEVALVFNTFLQGRELLLAVNRDFGLAMGADLAEDINRLNTYLIDCHKRGKCCVVIIDDAQNLDAPSLELLRLLSNLETRQHKLLQIVLSGQPELLVLLRKHESRQLASRIVLHIELAPLSRSECERYVSFRIARAGNQGRIRLSKAALFALYQHSQGNPRRMHLIMDRCLYGVVAAGRHQIGQRLVNTAAREGGMAPSPRTPRWLLATCVGIGAGLSIWAGLSLPGHSWLPRTAKSVLAVLSPIATVAVNPVIAARPLPAVKVPPTALQLAYAEKNKFQVCLAKIGASAWAEKFENGLYVDTSRSTLQSMAKDGLALAVLPAGMHWSTSFAAESNDHCSWDNQAGSMVLWRPQHQPFNAIDYEHGDGVRWLQMQLLATHLYAAPVDGVVGPLTRAALNVFQHQQGIPADTSVDAWTLLLLEQDRETQASMAVENRTVHVPVQHP